MTTVEHVPSLVPSASVLRPALLKRVVNSVVSAARAMRNRRVVYALGEMSDWELADIGLRRSDLHVVCQQTALGADPTLELGVIATARALEAQRSRRFA